MTPGHWRPDATGREVLTLSLNKFSASPVLIKNEYIGIKIRHLCALNLILNPGHNTSRKTWILPISNDE